MKMDLLLFYKNIDKKQNFQPKIGQNNDLFWKEKKNINTC